VLPYYDFDLMNKQQQNEMALFRSKNKRNHNGFSEKDKIAGINF
jgi:hypothetical protein